MIEFGYQPYHVCLHLLLGPDLGLGIDGQLEASNNTEKTQRGGSSKPLVIFLILLNGPDLAVAVDNVHGQDTSHDNGIVSERGSVSTHGDAATNADVPVDETSADVGVSLMEPLGEPGFPPRSVTFLLLSSATL